ncbi:hypothetical protein SEEHRA23_01130, partial [Salmonella enterica subsp. enterica serovar Heidelberg str. SARA33]
MQLNDSTLFRQQAFIDGDWRDARGGDVIPVSNPANGKPLGNVPKWGGRDARRHQRCQSRPARLARAHRQRASQYPASLVQS